MLVKKMKRPSARPVTRDLETRRLHQPIVISKTGDRLRVEMEIAEITAAARENEVRCRRETSADSSCGPDRK